VYLLDTNICIAVLNSNSLALMKLERQLSQCYISTIVLAELYKGAYCSQRIEYNLNKIDGLMGKIGIVDFDRATAEEFGKIQSELRLIGRPTGELDAAIASVARCRGDILVTNNTRHFINIAGLQLENWLNSEV